MLSERRHNPSSNGHGYEARIGYVERETQNETSIVTLTELRGSIWKKLLLLFPFRKL